MVADVTENISVLYKVSEAVSGMNNPIPFARVAFAHVLV